jgi:hypothetical protein
MFEELEKEIDELLEKLHQIYEETLSLKYSAEELRGYNRLIEDNLRFVREVLYDAKDVLNKIEKGEY